MAATNNKAEYAASAAVTVTLASLASDTNLKAGRSSAEIDNSSNKYFDYWISGKVTVGTTPTTNTVIEVWVIPKKNDSTYHDTFDGTDKNVTVTNRQMLQAYGKLLCIIEQVGTTSNVAYEFSGGVDDAIRSFAAPAKFQLFFVHNTGVALNATGGNHVIDQKGLYSTSGG